MPPARSAPTAPAPADFEKLGVFYLGREYDLAAKKAGAGLLLYDARDLVTHAVCVGMTGSGKTGLCLSLLEEAALDGVPAIAIDPKGDLANLLLTFPELRPEDFAPWINEEDAQRKGVTPADFAAQQAETWRKGLAAWGQDGDRIRRRGLRSLHAGQPRRPADLDPRLVRRAARRGPGGRRGPP
jgi:DNA helicase HerA-like ATPase